MSSFLPNVHIHGYVQAEGPTDPSGVKTKGRWSFLIKATNPDDIEHQLIYELGTKPAEDSWIVVCFTNLESILEHSTNHVLYASKDNYRYYIGDATFTIDEDGTAKSSLKDYMSLKTKEPNYIFRPINPKINWHAIQFFLIFWLVVGIIIILSVPLLIVLWKTMHSFATGKTA